MGGFSNPMATIITFEKDFADTRNSSLAVSDQIARENEKIRRTNKHVSKNTASCQKCVRCHRLEMLSYKNSASCQKCVRCHWLEMLSYKNTASCQKCV